MMDSPESGADSIGHGGARPHVSPLLQMPGHGGSVSRRTANKKLTNLYRTSRNCSQKRLFVLVEPKSGGQKNVKNLPTGIYIGHSCRAPLSLVVPVWVGAASTGDGFGHCWGRNGEFCVAVGPDTRTFSILAFCVLA